VRAPLLAIGALTVCAGLTAFAQGRQGAPAARLPPTDPQKVIFEMQDALGMLRGLQQTDAVTRIEYWGTKGSVMTAVRTAEISTFKVSINYTTPGMRFDVTRGGQREIQVVSGAYAWNEDVPGGKAVPMPAAAADRLLQIWLTPIGLAKAAVYSGEAKVAIEGGKTVVMFPAPGGQTIRTTLNTLYEPETVEARTATSAIAVAYSEYGDWNDDAKADVFLPRHIVQRRDGAVQLDLTLEHTNTYNPYVIMPVPGNVKAAVK
jgi:hypothetical protein